MTRPRWTTERVAELRRRMAEEGATLQLLADENNVSRQAIWRVIHWETERPLRMLWKRKMRLAQKMKLADVGG